MLTLAIYAVKNRSYKMFQRIGRTKDAVKLMHEALRILLLAGAGYIICNSGTIIVEKEYGLQNVGRFNAILKVGMVLASVSLLYTQISYPYVAKAWAHGNKDHARRLYLGGISIAVSSCAIFGALLYFGANIIFTKWLGADNYLGQGVVLWVLIYQLIFVHHVAHSTPVIAATGGSFTIPAILNAILVPICISISIKRFGISGVPIGMLIGTLPPSIWVVTKSWKIFHPKY